MARDRERILDAYLVASARLGDREALGTLVRRWNGKFIVHAWRLLRDQEGAKDAVQESWEEMLRGLPRLRDDDAFASWAYRIVSRRCARRIGRARADRHLVEVLVAAPAEESVAEPSVLDVQAVQKAIRMLPPDQQAAIALLSGRHERRRGGGRARRAGGHGEDPPDARAAQIARRPGRRRVMRDVDNLIEEALGREEKEILDRIGEDPGFFGMAFGLFSGRLGWVNILLMVCRRWRSLQAPTPPGCSSRPATRCPNCAGACRRPCC